MRRTILAGFAISMLATSFAANGQQYTVVNLGTLGGTPMFTNFPGSVGRGINASGQATGWALTTVDVEPQAFISNATTYALTGIGVAGNYEQAFAINASGQIAGNFSSYDFDEPTHAFVTDATTNAVTDLGTLGCGTRNYCNGSSYATGINTSGQVVGYSDDNTVGIPFAFITNPTTNAMINLGTLGGGTSQAFGINDSGQVTGYAQLTGSGWGHAFITDGTTEAMTDLGTLGGAQSWGYAINASGQVTGYSYLTGSDGNGPNHAFITDATTEAMTDLGTLGGTNSEGLAINTSGQVVGWSNTTAGGQDGFLYTGGQMLDLNSLLDATDAATYTISSANGINDSGQIIANGTVIATGEIVALLLNPVSN